MQYQVRAGDRLYLVEKIRAADDTEEVGSTVEIGWRPADARVFAEPLQ
ncbi:hypothetical protein VQ042_19515 [Aurantimonas sp. A2-1-M11]